jgi:hypothetical protein
MLPMLPMSPIEPLSLFSLTDSLALDMPTTLSNGSTAPRVWIESELDISFYLTFIPSVAFTRSRVLLLMGQNMIIKTLF